jgi:hypothetical protein
VESDDEIRAWPLLAASCCNGVSIEFNTVEMQ